MKSLPFFVAAVVAVALVGAQFPPGIWYQGLDKPTWTPPDVVFGPVWTVLYVCIAVAGWLVYRRAGSLASPAMLVWSAQLVLNGLWSWLFFGLQRPGCAIVDIAVLLLLILAFVVLSFPVSRPAALLFVPYAIWVGYAAALNVSIWRMNSPPAPQAALLVDAPGTVARAACNADFAGPTGLVVRLSRIRLPMRTASRGWRQRDSAQGPSVAAPCGSAGVPPPLS